MSIENPVTGLSGPATTTTPNMSKEVVPAPYRGVERASSSPSKVARMASFVSSITSRTCAFVSARRMDLMPGAATATVTLLGFLQQGSGVDLAYGAGAVVTGLVSWKAMEAKHKGVAHAAAGVTIALIDIAVAANQGPDAVSLTAWILATVVAYSPAIHVAHARHTSARGIKAALEAQGAMVPAQGTAPEEESTDLPSEVQPYVPQTNGDLGRVWLGDDLEGNPCEVNILYRHSLIAGAADWGKSGLVNLFMLRILDAGNSLIYGIDLKPGCPEIGPWEPVIQGLAGTQEEARALLSWVLFQEGPRRAEILKNLSEKSMEEGKGPVRKWTEAHGKFIYVICDELGELMRQAKGKDLKGQRSLSDLYESVLATTRFLGICFISATQQPSKKVFGGSTEQRGNYSNRLSTRMGEAIHATYVFGNDAKRRGFEPQRLTAQGQFFVASAETPMAVPYRCQWVDDRTIAREVNRLSALQGPREDEDKSEAKTLRLPAITDEPWVEAFAPVPAGPTYPDGTPVQEHWHNAWAVFEQMESSTKKTLADTLQCTRDTARRMFEVWTQHGVMSKMDGMSELFFIPDSGDAYDVAPGTE